ncbi:hypothetical protein B0H12DRAFT_1162647 [Mycena haematopus]|nr:hypothetical protein B0H12DRAFT_1162647 [Mycena haematopus]
MHRAFHIAEILDHIFAQLQSDDGLSRRYFAALARTCKSFQDPALNFLWREQDTLVNIFKCLPSHTWAIVTPAKRLHITSPLRPADLDIPLAYALRIRTLNLRAGQIRSDLLWVADTMQMLSSMLPRDHLCPNLTSILLELGLDSDSQALFSFIHLFLGPKIVHLDIVLPSSSPNVFSLLDLPIQYPQLRQFWLRGQSPGDQPFWDVLSKIALTLNRIESLALDKLDGPAIEHLSQLPALKSLRLEVPELIDLMPSSRFRSLIEPQTHRFSSLCDLYFGNTTIEFVIEFLALLSNCCLVNFHVGTTVLVEKSTTRRLYAALATHLAHSTLQILFVDVPEELEIETPTTSTLANYVVDGSILATTFCFANLTEIILRPPAGFDIDDPMAWDIARAWPRVHSLFLVAATELRHPSSMSLRGLSAFAKHCPELTYLGVTFDASTIPPPTPELIVSQMSLDSLDVSISPITDPPAVASFMSALFPNLATIYVHTGSLWEDVTEDDVDFAAYRRYTRWMKVKEILSDRRGATNALSLGPS